MSGFIVAADAPLHEAIRRIEEARRGIAVVVDNDGRLLGTVTDGDVRRAILAGRGLDSPVRDCMNNAPLSAPADASDAELSHLIYDHGLEALPLVDGEGRFVRVAHVRDLVTESHERGGAEGFAAAVIMAGGEGQRLRPLTESVPKPMVEVGGMPLVERHVRHLARAGVGRAFLSVNYLSHVIEDHFAGLGDLDIEIDYLREDRKMGTAGSLSLLPPLGQGPVLVFNSDVLHATDYANLLAFHQQGQAAVTVAVVEQIVQIPYGVIRAENGLLAGLEEKPSQRFLCNAGIYVLSPDAMKLLPAGAHIDMTDFLHSLNDHGLDVAVFPIHEYWADVADLDDLERVRMDIQKLEIAHG